MAKLKEDSEAKEKEEAQRLLDKESIPKQGKNQLTNSQDDVEEKNQTPLETTQEDWYMMEQVLKYAHSRDENKKSTLLFFRYQPLKAKNFKTTITP